MEERLIEFGDLFSVSVCFSFSSLVELVHF